jgi:hypothetical protein
MAIYAVIDLETNQLVNRVIAKADAEAPIGTKLILEPENYYWDGEQMSPMPVGVEDGN